MKPTTVRRLLKTHRWAGLAAAANLGVLVVTGALMLFESEIEMAGYASPPPPSPSVSLAQTIDLARAAAAGEAVFIARSFGDFPGVAFVGVSPSGALDDAVTVAVDMVRGEVTTAPQHDGSFFGVVWRLHTELLSGPRGMQFVGLIGVLFLVSLSTGLCIYLPMMRGFSWARFRSGRPLRAVIADIHKITGISVLVWGLVVASTGVLLAWGMPNAREYGVEKVTGSGPVKHDVADIDAAVAAAEHTRVKGRWWTIVMPHDDNRYGVVMRGGPGLGKRVVTLASVEANAPFAVTSRPVAEGVFVLGPIHFAEFGGLPLRLVWALFSVGLLGLLISGLYMRVARL